MTVMLCDSEDVKSGILYSAFNVVYHHLKALRYGRV